jgi:hypothetical protein
MGNMLRGRAIFKGGIGDGKKDKDSDCKAGSGWA